ncbi:hypothetical protein UlMin_032221 [Ulmus minor]
MDNKSTQLHILIFPHMSRGHTIPAIDIANLFASRGCKISIISTPANAPRFTKSIQTTKDLGLQIQILLIPFPSKEVGLPEGCESLHLTTTIEMRNKFLMATTLFEQPLEELLKQHRPDCLVADTHYPWATGVAAKFGIPRLIFHGTSCFAMCAAISSMRYEPYKNVSSETEPFLIPNLPDEIRMTTNQVPEFSAFVRKIEEIEVKSFGVIVNSFYELEPAYLDHYRKVFGRKAWQIGPLFLCNKETEDKANRGEEASVDKNECLKWLDSKKPNTVVYVSFGSLASFPDEQLLEIALALEASGQFFIWVVKREVGAKEEWLPEGFEKRMEGKGLIIRGWAPQLVILEHEAIGGFVTHCGWNSTLEGITAGVPMVTWPVAADQFYNEKLATQILKIGVGVGAKKCARIVGDSVKREAIVKALSRIMEGEEAEEMRSRARKLGEMARRAFEEGGSSYSDINSLIEELRSYSPGCDTSKE